MMLWGRGLEDSEHNKHFVVTNIKPTDAQSFDGGRTSVGNAEDRR